MNKPPEKNSNTDCGAVALQPDGGKEGEGAQVAEERQISCQTRYIIIISEDKSMTAVKFDCLSLRGRSLNQI